jgi:hypothetical protein
MMPALARAAAAADHAPGAARYVFVGSRLEQRGDVAGELNRLARRESKKATRGGGANGGAAAEGGKAAEGEEHIGGDAAAAEGAHEEEETFNTFATYGTAKQAGTALTYELARRVEAAAATRGAYGGGGGDCCGVAIHACTPGMVNTNLGGALHVASSLPIAHNLLAFHTHNL